MEKDLFGPIKAYFEAMGYQGDGEVKDIDLYLEKDGRSIAVELKNTLDFRAVQQAALRQKVADDVYIGTFCPKNMNTKSYRDRLYLLKRLGIGLIVVAPKSGAVSVANEPVVCELSSFRSRNTRQKKAVKKEFDKRISRLNTGGVSRTGLITGYREDVLVVLDALCSLGGEADARAIHAASGIEKTSSILRSDHYGWFTRPAKGLFGISEKGYAALEEYEQVLRAIMRPKGEA